MWQWSGTRLSGTGLFDEPDRSKFYSGALLSLFEQGVQSHVWPFHPMENQVNLLCILQEIGSLTVYFPFCEPEIA